MTIFEKNLRFSQYYLTKTTSELFITGLLVAVTSTVNKPQDLELDKKPDQRFPDLASFRSRLEALTSGPVQCTSTEC